jgi:hypothetical protein
MKHSVINPGYIELSGKVVASDPCYDRNVWCMATGITVKPGSYATYIIKKDEKKYGVRVAAILAVHADYVTSLKPDWEPYGCFLGVDSGQCGLFDDAVYPLTEDAGGKYDDEDSFYGECCKLTLGAGQGGILKTRNGIVSLSGYGDGAYELLCQNHGGECIALMIDFDLEKHSKIMRGILKSQRGQSA